MTPSDTHPAMALDLLAKAQRETDPEKRVRLEALAESYRRTGESKRLISDIELPPKNGGT